MKVFLREFGINAAAVVLFSIITFIVFQPAFQGKELVQNDVKQALAMAKEKTDFKEKTGEVTLWTNSMFGGMPTYLIGGDKIHNLTAYFNRFVGSLFVGWSSVFFLYMLCFYIMLRCFGIKTLPAVAGAVAFAFTSYNLIIIGEGHINKALAIAYACPVIGGVFLILKRKYLLGGAVTALFLSVQIAYNHIQITYYLALLIFLVIVAHTIYYFKEKEFKHVIKSGAFMLAAALLAVMSNFSRLTTTAEYSRESTRGGQSEFALEIDKEGAKQDYYNYYTSWSYGVSESISLLIPGFYGGGSSEYYRNTETYKKIFPILRNDYVKRGVARKEAAKIAERQIAGFFYWGDQPFTAGPVYAGAVMFFLFLMGLILLKGPVRWWLLAGFLLTLFLSWGKNFPVFTDLFFYNLPYYNKFRVPSMILSVTVIIICLTALLAVKKILDAQSEKKQILKAVKISAGITGGLALLFFLFGSSIVSFSGASDTQFANILDLIQEDRRAILRSDSLRTAFFIIAAAGLIWAFVLKKLKTSYFIVGIGLLMVTDVALIGRKYLSADDFVRKAKSDNMFQPTAADLEILKDKDPNFRVLNLTVNTFNDALTSYHHKSIGGYHPAKLRRYQDLIDQGALNSSVLNMLNTRYIIASDREKGAPFVQKNPAAVGNSWFVERIKIVNGAVEEMAVLKDTVNLFDPLKTAVIEKKFAAEVEGLNLKPDTNDFRDSFIRLTLYQPNKLKYESSSPREELAVFSEIYYNPESSDGWQAYIDGKKVPHFRVNYILRGLRIPPGNHNIEFVFEDTTYTNRALLTKLFSGLVIVLAASAFFFEGRKHIIKQEKPAESKK